MRFVDAGAGRQIFTVPDKLFPQFSGFVLNANWLLALYSYLTDRHESGIDTLT